MEDPQPGPKPFLRRGSGWEARVAAAREGRRYRPKGGPVHSYGDPEAGPPALRSPAKAAGPSRQKPGLKQVQAPQLKPQPQTNSKGPAGTGARLPARGAAPAAAATAKRNSSVKKQAMAPAQQLAQRGTPAHSQPQTELAGTGVPMGAASRLPAPRAWGAEETEEDLELQEFCALESEVLREVSNTATAPAAAAMSGKPAPCSPRLAWSAPAAAAPGGNRCSSASNWPVPQSEPGCNSEEEDVFQSDGEGEAGSAFCPAQQPNRPQSKAVSFAESCVLVEEEEEKGELGELDAQSELIDELPTKPTSSLVQKFFYSHKAEKATPPPPEAHPGDMLQRQVEELEEQVKKLNEERAKVAHQRRQVEDARARLEHDRAALEKRKAEELAQVEAMKAEEQRKLQRDRRVLEKQSRALLKLPTKREKEEIQALEAVLEKERQNARGKDARHKLTVDRLRRQILELQEKNRELQEQVQYLEAERLQRWGADPPVSSPAKHSAPSALQHQQAVSGGQAAANDSGSSSGQAPRLVGSAGQEASRRQPMLEISAYTSQEAHAAAAAEEGSELHNFDTQEEQEADYVDGGHSIAEELEEGAILVDALPTVRVSVHKQPAAAAMAAHRLSLEEVAQPQLAGTAAVCPAVPPAAAHAEAQQAVVADVMSKASTALSRFNQLKESLMQHGGLQQKLSSRLSSLQATPAAGATLEPATQEAAQPESSAAHTAASESRPAAGAAVAPAGSGQDDLRRLGRMLTMASAVPAPPPLYTSSTVPAAAHSWPAGQAPGAAPAAAPAAPTVLQSGVPPTQIPAAAAAAAAPAVVAERQYGDGRMERVYASGLRVQEFSNGSRKHYWLDGRTAVCFGNGDAKKTWPDGRVEYYYDAVGCWHVTHPHGVEVFYFPSGQVEAHHPGGIKEIMFPDGSVRKVLPDGRELAITPQHLSPEIQLPQPEAALTFSL